MAAPSHQCRALTRETIKNRTVHDCGAKKSAVSKRKRSPDGLVETRKKIHEECLVEPPQQCPLIEVFRQYGLLETIVSNLCPDDLKALLSCSKSMHQTLVPRPGSLENLLRKLTCSGRGVRIRNKRHKKSRWYDVEYIPCSTVNPQTEVHACVNCKVSTCDECRIHCVYQSMFEHPNQEDELPYVSGFVLLSAPEIPILSLHQIAPDYDVAEWLDPSDPSTGQIGPYHDQGFIDVPYESVSFGPPECVKDILDLDLGQYTLAGSAHSHVADPSPTLEALHHVTEQRKRIFCDACLPPQLADRQGSSQTTLCRCTLRGRFLGRWLCLRCYETEEASMLTAYCDHFKQCGCGEQVGNTVCLWCFGTVHDHSRSYRVTS
ncbi:hypothetical protein BDW02DRAFT_570512 [Decorospora gaudefroyi]|uniref:Uncharacterized protein n=1 Tax=Decorospora gaudefroyi TaxID=184978 RepID=A0A6A5K9K1_9PLEO|nr:hypothetical protein BDW02DRAFT_570512 [Decorospora gaudefroyi]